jgi:rod shape-determining protein MreC
MRSLLNILARYHNLIIFIVLEGIAIYLLADGNNYHNSRIMNGLRGVTQGIEGRVSYTHNFLRLLEINKSLSAENTELRNRLERISGITGGAFQPVSDTLYNQKYLYLSAAVVDNSVNLQKNFLTLDKGKRHGVSTDMAVITSDGVAGVIVVCSDNFSVAMSVLNLDFKLSARFKTNGYFGSVSWNGRNPGYAVLSEIPQHVVVNVGDTIETTGYSSIFPEGVVVGTVSEFEKSGGDFYKITLALATDFRKLHFVEIIGNLKKEEIIKLETLTK